MSPKATLSGAAKPRVAKKSRTASPKIAKKPHAAKPKVAKKPRAAKSKVAKKPHAASPKLAKKSPAVPPGLGTLETIEDLIMQALVMELDAGERYGELADAMETHNNLEVAALFRKLANIETRHAREIQDELGWTTMPATRPAKMHWEGFETPETAPGDEVHYLMQPYHALQVALANEQRAERFFARLARVATTEIVKKAARELQAEERGHVKLVRAWLAKVPKPDVDWANDPDPPVNTD